MGNITIRILLTCVLLVATIIFINDIVQPSKSLTRESQINLLQFSGPEVDRFLAYRIKKKFDSIKGDSVLEYYFVPSSSKDDFPFLAYQKSSSEISVAAMNEWSITDISEINFGDSAMAMMRNDSAISSEYKVSLESIILSVDSLKREINKLKPELTRLSESLDPLDSNEVFTLALLKQMVKAMEIDVKNVEVRGLKRDEELKEVMFRELDKEGDYKKWMIAIFIGIIIQFFYFIWGDLIKKKIKKKTKKFGKS